MFQAIFKDVAIILQDCFKCIKKEVSKVFQVSFNVLWGEFQQCVNNFLKAHPGGLNGFLKVLPCHGVWHFLSILR